MNRVGFMLLTLRVEIHGKLSCMLHHTKKEMLKGKVKRLHNKKVLCSADANMKTVSRSWCCMEILLRR